MFQDGRSDSDPLPSYKAIAGPSFGKTRFFGAATRYNCLVSGTFNPPLRVLFNVLSRYYCTIGLRMYLGLGDSVSQIHTGFPTHATQNDHCAIWICTYGAFTLFGSTFQYISVSSMKTATWRLNTTSPCSFRQGFSLPSSDFDRLY